MTNLSYDTFLQKFPFLSIARYGKNEYVGIIQNEDVTVTTMYLLELIKTQNERKEFIKYGSEWWWETNRQIPINLVIGEKFKKFDYCLKSFSNKNFEILYGPTVRLRDLLKYKSKKKNIQLIRRMD